MGIVRKPAEVLDSLINAKEVLASLIGAETIVFDLEAAQHVHARSGQRVAVHMIVPRERGQPGEVVLEEAQHLLEGLGALSVVGLVFQPLQRFPSLILVLAILEEVPHTAEELTDPADFGFGFHQGQQGLALFGFPALVRLEERIAVLPKRPWPGSRTSSCTRASWES
jgi:hypothetical protein